MNKPFLCVWLFFFFFFSFRTMNHNIIFCLVRCFFFSMSWEPSYHILFVTFFDEVEKHKTKSYVEDFFPWRNNLFFLYFGHFSRYQQYLWAFHILKHTPYIPSLSFGFFIIFHSYGTSHHITIFCKNFCVKVNHDTTQHTTPRQHTCWTSIHTHRRKKRKKERPEE